MGIEIDIPNAKRILRELMEKGSLRLDAAEEEAVKRYDNPIVFDQAKMALRQEGPQPPKSA